ncbi:hypothetical protein ANCCAN_13649 [Ancylostoma caninum]|uniref:Uncharacterized protein n=2 Tax=Ancylostoma TaxID=29169 RepID=A0A368G7J8_ANCCA|nr:hypothetical protein ANCCAN_13649 [Ancylostoma caninum]
MFQLRWSVSQLFPRPGRGSARCAYRIRNADMPSHQSPSANLGYLSQSCESPMFVGPPGVWGDWTNAMRSFEELVDQYETEALQLDDSSLASIEANITRSLCIVIACKPLMARSLMAPWLRVVGLSQPNIQYLEISGVIDLNVLFMKAEKDVS